jgi:hypothetical protein
METHPTKEHQHQAIQTTTKAKTTAVGLAAFTAVKLTLLLIEKMAQLLKKDPKDKDTVAIRMNGKTVYRGEFKDGVALKPKIDKLSEPQVAYLAAIVDAKKGQSLNSKTPVQVEVNGQRVFEALDGEVKTNELPPGFGKAFAEYDKPIPTEAIAVEEPAVAKPSIENPRDRYIALSNCNLDSDQMKDAIDVYPKLGISLDRTVLENAREKGLANDEIKQILESGPYYSKMEREGFTPEQIDKRYLNPLLNGNEKSVSLPQESVDKLKGLGVDPATIQNIAEQTKSAGQSVSPIIVVQQQVQRTPKTSLRDQLSSHLSRITELPSKWIEQVKEGLSKAMSSVSEERQANLMPQQLQVAQSIDFLSSRYGQEQQNGDRSFKVGPYSMTRSPDGGLDLNHKDRGSIFSLKGGQVQSSLTNADMGRFQQFKANVMTASRQGPVIEVG